ncbi:MAG: phenylalanine--tRNA ligase subunit beta [Nitrospirae bacterium]|nr:phenylalanine--tRNA ligase subunit beta [Nitrospirota bacterium]
MKASIKWLKEFVDFPLSPKEIAIALTMSGLEVEALEERDDDAILEVSIPPNRPDCLSIMGIAREISAILRLPFKNISVSVPKEEGEPPSVEIKDSALCRRYASRIIRGVKVAPSPQRISHRLELHGFRPANNVVDITNYVLLEMGHPLHAFDLGRLAGNRIIVKTAGPVNKILTLDNAHKNLAGDMLLIWDADKPVAIAGIMGGLDTEVSSSTVNILLESAYFNPVSVRRTSKAINLSTESSYRFERGADIEGLGSALNRAAQLIAETAGGKLTAMTDNYPAALKPVHIPVSLSKINKILGVDIDFSVVRDLLIRLGFEIKRAGEGITVIPPSFRQDIQRDIDVIEEIARLYGYDKFPATLPAVRMQTMPQGSGLFPATYRVIKTIENSMRSSGFSEVINYSFLNPLVFDTLRFPVNDKRREVIKIRNPLRKEEEALRTTLIPALLDNVILNISRGEKSLRFFELTRVFLPAGQKLPHESLRLAAVYLKSPHAPSLWQGKHEGFYEMKGAMENLFIKLRIKNYSFTDSDLCEPYLYPGKSCAVSVNGRNIGSLGTLHPALSESLDI